jgi:hypothetical protein
MRCLYQKDERALPGNLLNRIYIFLLSYSKCRVFHYFATSLSLSVVPTINSEESVRCSWLVDE